MGIDELRPRFSDHDTFVEALNHKIESTVRLINRVLADRFSPENHRFSEELLAESKLN